MACQCRRPGAPDKRFAMRPVRQAPDPHLVRAAISETLTGQQPRPERADHPITRKRPGQLRHTRAVGEAEVHGPADEGLWLSLMRLVKRSAGVWSRAGPALYALDAWMQGGSARR